MLAEGVSWARTACEGLLTGRPFTLSAPALMAALTRARDVPLGRAAERKASARGGLLPTDSKGGTCSEKRCGRGVARVSACCTQWAC